MNSFETQRNCKFQSPLLIKLETLIKYGVNLQADIQEVRDRGSSKKLIKNKIIAEQVNVTLGGVY